MTTTAIRPSSDLLTTLRGVYALRAAFAIVWALVLIVAMPDLGPLLTALLVVYPVVDAGAVLLQVRSDTDAAAPRSIETINIVVSVAVAVAVGVASTSSVAAAVGVWGVWAVLSGTTQLLTAVRRRRAGAQIPQMLSGAISAVAGVSFLLQATQGTDSITSVAGYSLLGGLFFLVSAIRVTMLLRTTTSTSS